MLSSITLNATFHLSNQHSFELLSNLLTLFYSKVPKYDVRLRDIFSNVSSTPGYLVIQGETTKWKD